MRPFSLLLALAALLLALLPACLANTPLHPDSANFPGYAIVNGTTVYVGPAYVTPDIVYGVLVSFFLLFMLSIGVSCLSSIQKPVRFASVPLQLAKEY